MNIEIKRLTSELVEDYLHFFDFTPYDDSIDEHKCYCVCWCSADHLIANDFSSQEKRRELARKYVTDGVIQGYLAYDDNRVVGWCNANTKADCKKCISWLRFMKCVNTDDVDFKIKSVFCFVISPEMQRKGIATKLLKRVCEDAKTDGYEAVESYPKKEFINTARGFMGPAKMYEKLRFKMINQIGDEIIMRKDLR